MSGLNKISEELLGFSNGFATNRWTATAGQTLFTLPVGGKYIVGKNRLQVTVGGVPQHIGDNFTETSTTSFTLTEGVDAGTLVDAVWYDSVLPATGGHNQNHKAGGSDELDIKDLKGYTELITNNYILLTNKSYSDLCPKDVSGIVTDWLPAINQAIIDADTYERPILLPFNNVPISNSIIISRNNIRLVGYGKSSTVIKPQGAFPAIVLNGNSTTGVYYNELKDFQIDGGNTATIGIQFNYARENWVNDVYITKCVKGVTASQSWSNGIRSSEIVGNTDKNVELGDQSNDFSLIDCQLDRGGNYGLHVTADSYGISLIGCCVQSCGKDGVLLDAGRGVTIQGGYFENNNTSLTASTADIRLSGNAAICRGVSLSGMTFFGLNTQVCIITDKANGISISGVNAGLLSGGTTNYLIQTTANTSNVFIAGVSVNLVSGFPYNDVGNAITRIDSKYIWNVGWQNNTTANRPTSPFAGQIFLDNTVNKPIWRNGVNSRWINAEGVAPENRGINVAITAGATTFSTGFGFNEPDTSYAATVTPSWNTTVWVTGKLVSGFVVNFGTAAPSGGTIDWSIKR